MATPSTVQLQSRESLAYQRPGITPDATSTVSRLLQENHDNYHIFFRPDGFHNHIAHHLLTLWALSASSKELQHAYDINKNYQRPSRAPKPSVLDELQDPAKFIKYLGPEEHYNDFLAFFRAEMEKNSWQDVVQKYLFAGDERAEIMLVQFYAGFLHPIIHVGFGIEFNQPAIIAEGLAQTACHDNWIGRFLKPAEQAANQRRGEPSKSIVELLDEIHADDVVRAAPHWADSNKIRDGLMERAADSMIDYGAQVRVKPNELAEKMAEMTNAAAYYTAGAQRSDKAVKFDFYFMHCVNYSIFFPPLLKQDWISEATKVRLLEWKIRMDLTMYASRKSPDIHLDEIRNYKPKKPSGWDEILARVCGMDDDGHAAKLVRAIAHGQKLCEPYESSDAFRLKRDDWLQLGHMAIDSVEGPGNNWVRSAGFDEAWTDMPARAQL